MLLKMIKQRRAVVLIFLALFLLQGCASNHKVKAPCDNFGRYCEPKIKINQWTPANARYY